MSRLMFLLAGCWVILALGNALGQDWLFFLGLGLFFLASLFYLIYMNTNNRIRR